MKCWGGDIILVIFQKSHFKEKLANFTQNHQKTIFLLKNTGGSHLKWLKFDESNWNEHVCWKLAQLRDTCRKYLAFLVNFDHIFKGGMDV